MRLRQLFESRDPSVAIIFGRFNPPHFGHVDAWREAAKFPAWYVGTNQSTEGPKDPLPFDIKIEAMKTMYPEIEEHLVAEQSWFTLAVMVYKRHGENTILKIVTDPEDKKIYVPMIQKQNGLEGPHGYYKFADIQWHKADRKSEASLVRKAVKENNPKDFEKYSGVPANTVVAGQPYFQLVRKYMLPYMAAEEEKLKKQQERDKLKADKDKLKAEKPSDKKKGAMDLSTLRAAAKTAKPVNTDSKVAEGLKNPKDNPCWKGYKPVGTKQKNGKTVPNCVPKESVKEEKSKAMDQTAKRLTDPKDGATAKLRAAGDKKRQGNLSQQQSYGRSDEAANAAQQAAIAISMKKAGKKPKKGLKETQRMSTAVKLQRAWEREQQKSAASYKRGQEYMNKIKVDVANKHAEKDKEGKK